MQLRKPDPALLMNRIACTVILTSIMFPGQSLAGGVVASNKEETQEVYPPNEALEFVTKTYLLRYFANDVDFVMPDRHDHARQNGLSPWLLEGESGGLVKRDDWARWIDDAHRFVPGDRLLLGQHRLKRTESRYGYHAPSIEQLSIVIPKGWTESKIRVGGDAETNALAIWSIGGAGTRCLAYATSGSITLERHQIPVTYSYEDGLLLQTESSKTVEVIDAQLDLEFTNIADEKKELFAKVNCRPFSIHELVRFYRRELRDLEWHHLESGLKRSHEIPR